MSDFQNAVIKLLSSPHYKELATYEPPFNPFEIVGATHLELIHSSVLAWLLRDEANKEFRQKFVAKMAEIATATGKELEIEFSPPDGSKDCRFEKVCVETEHGFKTKTGKVGRIDVFAKLETLNLVIGIEVKVRAGEQSEQIEGYQTFLKEEYSQYKKAVVFLTRWGYPSKTDDKSRDSVPVLEMSWSDIAWIIKEMRSALGDENDFRMQFSQHLERNILMNEREEQRIVRKLLSEGDNEKTLYKIFGNMPLQGYSAQWKKMVAEVCGVKEEGLEEKTYSEGGIVKELKIRIPEWRNAGLPFTVMLYKYQNAGVRILLLWKDYYEMAGPEPEPKAEFKEFAKFANRSNGVVNEKFPKLPGWLAWHSVLAKHEPNAEVEETLIDDIWSEDWKEKAEKRLREQIEDSGLLDQINEWIEYKRRK